MLPTDHISQRNEINGRKSTELSWLIGRDKRLHRNNTHHVLAISLCGGCVFSLGPCRARTRCASQDALLKVQYNLHNI
jgi:hypothetical protein